MIWEALNCFLIVSLHFILFVTPELNRKKDSKLKQFDLSRNLWYDKLTHHSAFLWRIADKTEFLATMLKLSACLYDKHYLKL